MKEYKASNIILFATPYFLVTACLYIYAYWSRFDINIFQYINVSDFIDLAVYAVFFTIIINVFILSIGLVMHNLLDMFGDSKKNDSSKIFSDKTIARIDKGMVVILILVQFSMIIIIFYSLFFEKEPVKWYGLAGGWAALVAFALHHEKYKIFQFVGGYNILWVLVLVPAYSFTQGKLNSYNLLYGPVKKYVILKDNKNNILLEEKERYRYIGYAGDHHFLLAVGSSNIHVIKSSSDIRLIFKLVK